MPEDSEVLKPILLRSSTPGPNEKVLKYLEGLPSSGTPDDDLNEDDAPHNLPLPWSPPSPVSKSQIIHSPAPRASANSGNTQLDELAQSHVSYADVKGDDNDEGESNIQDGQRSELGSLHPISREPGPNDPPGPRYESFDSGPSFGNMGPLPEHGATYSSWKPMWPTSSPGRPVHDPLPERSIGDPMSPHIGIRDDQGWGDSLTPGAHKIALPESVVSRGGDLDVPSPASHNGSMMSPFRAFSDPAPMPPSEPRSSGIRNGEFTAYSKAMGKPSASRGTESEGHLSPDPPYKSPTSFRSPGIQLPPLPSSAFGGSSCDNGLVPHKSSRSPAHRTQTASVSPDDSMSQGHSSKSIPKSPTSSKALPVKPSRSNASEPGWEGEKSSRSYASRGLGSNGGAVHSQAPGSVMSVGQGTHQTRPFSPYRHAATQDDLLHTALRAATSPPPERLPSVHSTHGVDKESSLGSKRFDRVGDATPTPSRPTTPHVQSPQSLINDEEQRIINETLRRTPRPSSYAPSMLESELVNSHFHDMDLCVLLHEVEDPSVHEVVKRALRKAVRQRVKKLGMKYDNESIAQYRKSFHDHDPKIHLQPDYMPNLSTQHEAPDWAVKLMEGMNRMEERLGGLEPKIERLKSSRGSRLFPVTDAHYHQEYSPDDDEEFGRTPMTQTVNIHTQPTGTVAESMFRPAETEIIGGHDDYGDEEGYDNDVGVRTREMPAATLETRTRGHMSEMMSEGRDDSPGQQYLEKELYKLRVTGGRGSQSAVSHRTWEIARDTQGEFDDEDDEEEDEDEQDGPDSGIPEIPDTNEGGYTDRRAISPPLPPIPQDAQGDVARTPDSQLWPAGQYGSGEHIPVSWQRIHQRLLSWAIIWPTSELDTAVNSTTRGHQVDEVALSIWSTQCYKRYVRAKMTDHPPGRVDRLFVPPNMADAINTAVFNGRHGDASGMLRDLWSPFGLEGMPRLLVVLAKHRSDENHWVVHRFSLPDGSLTTYDSYPERTLPDGRPLGWWFAIRVAWPNAIYPSPDHLMQKMVRLHRPLQLGIDNSVAAAGIWRNVLMGSRAERSIDLERLRDLINTEVKNLRQRKHMGKLSIGSPRPNWEDLN